MGKEGQESEPEKVASLTEADGSPGVRTEPNRVAPSHSSWSERYAARTTESATRQTVQSTRIGDSSVDIAALTPSDHTQIDDTIDVRTEEQSAAILAVPVAPDGTPRVDALDLEPRPESDRRRHVRAMARMMRLGTWEKGKSSAVYAEEHGIHPRTSETMATEAWRLLTMQVTDPDQVTRDIARNLGKRLETASNKDAAKIADVWSRVVGARAPEKHEVHVEAVRNYETLTPVERAAWLDKTIASLTRERRKLALVLAGKGDAPSLPDWEDDETDV